MDYPELRAVEAEQTGEVVFVCWVFFSISLCIDMYSKSCMYPALFPDFSMCIMFPSTLFVADQSMEKVPPLPPRTYFCFIVRRVKLCLAGEEIGPVCFVLWSSPCEAVFSVQPVGICSYRLYSK